MDQLTLNENWSIQGLTGVLLLYPIIQVSILIGIIRVALASPIVNGNYVNKVVFNTKTKKRPFNRLGRRYGEKFCLQGVSRDMRRGLSNEGSFEVDIANCHPTILDRITRKYCRSLALEGYIENREWHLSMIGTSLGVTKAVAKELVIVILNGGSWVGYIKKSGMCNELEIGQCQFLDVLQSEIITSMDMVRRGVEFSDIYRELKAAYPNEKEKSLRNLTLSTYLEREERKIIDVAIDESLLMGIRASTLLHDGFIVSDSCIEGEYIRVTPNSPSNGMVKISHLLGVLSQVVIRKTGYDVAFSVRWLFYQFKLDCR